MSLFSTSGFSCFDKRPIMGFPLCHCSDRVTENECAPVAGQGVEPGRECSGAMERRVERNACYLYGRLPWGAFMVRRRPDAKTLGRNR